MSLYLAAIYAIFGYQPLIARLITGLLSTGVVGLIFLLARRLFGERVAFISGLIAAVYAYLVFYGVTLVTETPFILGLLVAIYLAYRMGDSVASKWQWVVLGMALAVTILFRMAVIFYVPVLLVWIIVRWPRQWFRALIPVVIIGCAILPFTIRNHQLWGRFLLLESQFGHVFWNGNHPDHRGNFHPYKVFPIPQDVLVGQNDAVITNRLLQMGIQNVINDPGHFLLLTLTRLREFFKFWPTSDSSALANLMRVLSFGIMWPFALIGLILARQRWRDLLPILLFMVVHTGVYAVSWTMIRYRIPLDALLIPFAGLAVANVISWAGRRVRFAASWGLR